MASCFVGDVGNHHVIAGLQEGEEHSMQGGHARGESGCRLGAFHSGKLCFQGDLVGSGISGVHQSVVNARPIRFPFGGYALISGQWNAALGGG